MQTAVERDARSAFLILAICIFSVVLASIAFMASGGAQIVRTEIPARWLTGGLQVR